MGVSIVLDILGTRACLELKVGGLVDAAGDGIAGRIERCSRVCFSVDVLGSNTSDISGVAYNKCNGLESAWETGDLVA